MSTPDQQTFASDLAQFTGTEGYTNLRYPWLRGRKFLLTDGSKYLAEQAKAFWLMDAIASHQTNKQVAADPFQVWDLVVKADHAASLICTGDDSRVLAQQEIPFTDFPLENIRLYVSKDDYLGGWVVMLTSEY